MTPWGFGFEIFVLRFHATRANRIIFLKKHSIQINTAKISPNPPTQKIQKKFSPIASPLTKNQTCFALIENAPFHSKKVGKVLDYNTQFAYA
jgi:hypothetical protein